jgi:hypothetical protein
MRTTDLINLVNNLLAGELLNYEDLEHHFDSVIDDINTTCCSDFPTFTDLRHLENNSVPTEYAMFPDKYIRSVVAKGAAYKYFTEDEEGIATAQTYGQEYQQALFYMLRDYADYCEPWFKRHLTRGAIKPHHPEDFYAGGPHEYATIWNL